MTGTRPGTRTAKPHYPPWSQAWEELAVTLDRIASTEGPIVAGPWFAEVGVEVLYWIPFLRHLVSRGLLDPGRVVAVSRGGAAEWYAGLCGEYRDIFAVMSASEFRTHVEGVFRAAGGRKQQELGPVDTTLLDATLGRGAWTPDAVLHPSLLHVFRDYWRGRVPIAQALERLDLARWERPHDDEIAARLPDRFAAVRFYFRPSFPDTPENRETVLGTVDALAARMPVVLLNTNLELDDHLDADPGAGAEVLRLLDGVPRELNLHVQTVAISRASLFVGTYGGLSHVPPMYGVPSLAFATEPGDYASAHNDLARRAAAACGAWLAVVDRTATALLGATAAALR